jgi:hypothetical protein
MKPALLFGDFGQTARFSKSTPFANSSLPPNTSCAGRLSPEDLGTYRRKMAAPQIFFASVSTTACAQNGQKLRSREEPRGANARTRPWARHPFSQASSQSQRLLKCFRLMPVDKWFILGNATSPLACMPGNRSRTMADSKSGAMTKQVLSLWDFADIFADFPQGHVFCLSKPFSEPKIRRDVQLFAAFPRRRIKAP